MNLIKNLSIAGACIALAVGTGVAAQTAPLKANSVYKINVDDELEISVWGEQRLQREVKVLPDGSISFPLVGQLQAQGRIPQELEAKITEGLRGQYRGQVPQVTVSVKSAAGLSFSVLGKVRTAGTYAPGRYVNVLEAMSLAGGPTEFANLDRILILRKQGTALVQMRVSLGSVFRAVPGPADLADNNLPVLAPGDTVIVP